MPLFCLFIYLFTFSQIDQHLILLFFFCLLYLFFFRPFNRTYTVSPDSTDLKVKEKRIKKLDRTNIVVTN